MQEEVEARLEAERRLREAEASLTRLEIAVEKKVTKQKVAAAAVAAEKQVTSPATGSVTTENDTEKKLIVEEDADKIDEMIADVRTLKRK